MQALDPQTNDPLPSPGAAVSPPHSPPILVATDLSPGSAAALDVAIERSLRRAASLVVCHVLPGTAAMPTEVPSPEGIDGRLATAAAERGVRAQVGAAQREERVPYQLRIGGGVPSQWIAKQAFGVGAGLIVVGRGGAVSSAPGASSGDEEGTAVQLARDASVATLVVHRGRSVGPVTARRPGIGASDFAFQVARREARQQQLIGVELHDDDPIGFAIDRFAALIVVDAASALDDVADLVRRAPCSVLIVRGDANRTGRRW